MANLKEVTWNTNIQTKEIQRSDGSCSYLFWLIVLILTSIMFIFETYRSFNLYMNNPLASNLEQVFFENITLPAVAACVTESVTIKAQDDFGKTDPNDVLFIATAVAFVPPFFEQNEDKGANINWMASMQRFQATMTDLGIKDLHHYIVYDAGLEIDETIEYCALRGEEFDCTGMFTQRKFWDADYCFMADSYRNFQTVPGSRGGLTLHLKTDKLVAKYNSGWSIWLYSHPDGDELPGANFPQPVTAGFMVDLRVRKWRSIRINRRGSKCQQNVHDPSFAVCQHRCEAKASFEVGMERGVNVSEELREFCDHVTMTNVTSKLGSVSGIPIRLNLEFQQHGCVRIGQWNEDKEYPYCKPGIEGMESYWASGEVTCKCTVAACESVEYKSEILVRKMTDNENTTIVRIYYDTLSEMVLEQKQTVSVAQLVGSFGGQASLWLGIKVATIAQFLFYANGAVLQKMRGTRGAVADSKA